MHLLDNKVFSSGNFAFHMQCKFEKCAKILIALPYITCLTATAKVMSAWLWAGTGHFFLNSESQPFKYGSISICIAP